MQYKLSKFVNMWDEAALETLNNEFSMMDLMQAQSITNADGSSLLDYLVFDGNSVVIVPETVAESSTYFKAPWEN